MGGEVGVVAGDRKARCSLASFDSFCHARKDDVRRVLCICWRRKEGGREDVQDKVNVISEEGTHDKRKCAAGKGEQEHVHGRRFVLAERFEMFQRYWALPLGFPIRHKNQRTMSSGRLNAKTSPRMHTTAT